MTPEQIAEVEAQAMERISAALEELRAERDEVEVAALRARITDLEMERGRMVRQLANRDEALARLRSEELRKTAQDLVDLLADAKLADVGYY